MSQQLTPSQYRVQYLDLYSNVIDERHAYANGLAGAVALVEGLTVPAGAFWMRFLDADGHLLHSKMMDAVGTPRFKRRRRRAWFGRRP
jgi:hypothetical protein